MIEVIMGLTKSTKNTHVYTSEESTTIPTLYIKKEDLPKEPPKVIKVEVEWEDE